MRRRQDLSPVWQDEIENEVRRNAIRLLRGKQGFTSGEAVSSVDHTLREVHRAFPDACAATELWTPLVPKMTCDDKDRHVLAVAVGANATHVLTINTRDFPVHSRPAGVIVQTPDRFLRDRLAETPDLVVDAIAALSQRLKNPTQTTTEIAKLLAKGQFIPNFGADLLDALGGRPGA